MLLARMDLVFGASAGGACAVIVRDSDEIVSKSRIARRSVEIVSILARTSGGRVRGQHNMP